MTDIAAAKKKLLRSFTVFLISLAIFVLGCVLLARVTTYAAPGVTIDFTAGDAGEGSMGVLEILFLFVLIGLLPSLLLMMTSFTRIIIVLSFMRNALGTQQSPPNQVLVGLALFLTIFIMQPVFQDIYVNAYQPYQRQEMTAEEALDAASVPVKSFMARQTSIKSVNLFIKISDENAEPLTEQTSLEQVTQQSLAILVPAFITSELERAFLIGFLLYLPFLIIDMVVSSILMSMGMVMLPPAMISLPFKILMFVLVGGWGLLMGTIVQGFH